VSNNKLSMNEIELNEQFLNALELMEKSDKNIFITGRAGTGKSTLLMYFCNITKKKVVVLAPTGVAALNVNGETIHSFFKFKPNVTVENIEVLDDEIYREIDTIIIDEISMVRADLLDCIDKFLRLNARDFSKPFGGVQMILMGDLYQLPPVVTKKEREFFKERYRSEYFFDSDVFKDVDWEFIELKKIYRQDDDQFMKILNEIRTGTITDESLLILSRRVNAQLQNINYAIYLTSHNQTAKNINQEKLNQIKGKLYKFEAEIQGDFDESSFPADYVLSLKKGAQIMMLNNDSDGRWVNGFVGKIIDVHQDDGIVKVLFSNGRIEEVTRYTWDIFHYRYNRRKKMIETEIVGTFSQFPMRLAWAVTIHKSQGKTFDNVTIDLSKRFFAPGQLYVALSRCTRLSGISLTRAVTKKDIILDRRILRFLSDFQCKNSEKKLSMSEKMELINRAIELNKYLLIVYVRSDNEKSRRIVEPRRVGEFSYSGKKFLGLQGYCFKKKDLRTFRIDRILDIELIEDREVIK